MSKRDYSFLTEWRLQGTCEQVYLLLNDIDVLKRYWPSLYKEVAFDDDGRTVKVRTKGFLPYVIDWMFRVTHRKPFEAFGIEAWGDLVGKGEWRLRQEGEGVNVEYLWTVTLEKPWLNRIPLLRPLLGLNHAYVMRQGEKGLQKAIDESRRLP